MKTLLAWLDHRTGFQELMHEALYENVPSGARFRYVTGSMLVFAFVVQAVTGVFLWMGYSPSSQTAWESVYYIQHQMTMGWLLRGIHHFMAQMMVVVMALHLLQVVVDGAYRAPREVNYWLGLILMQIVLGLGLTGYLLPWDQKGYWATNVATNLMTLVPFVGAELQQVVIGGKEYGHHTLTRFFAMHAGVLPALLVIFLALHIAAFRRHGITAKITPGRPDQDFWPHQVLYDAIACAVMLGIVVACVFKFGAELGAPADPSEQYSAARPEWYYLFLFQLLKYFHGTMEIVGALVIPGVVMGVLFLLPILGRSRIGHRFSVVFTVLLLVGSAVLTVLAMVEDNYDIYARWRKIDDKAIAAMPKEQREMTIKYINSAKEFHEAKEDAERQAHRIVELVGRREMVDGKVSEPRLIPKQGAVYLLRNDPLTQGPRLFNKHCASCHDYVDPSGKSEVKFAKVIQTPLRKEGTAADKPEVRRNEDGQVLYDEMPNGAPNLFGFASRNWIAGLLDKDQIAAVTYGEPIPSEDEAIRSQKDHPDNFQRSISSPYFGNTAHRDGRMVQWLKEHGAKLDKDDLQKITIALSAQAQLRTQAADDAKQLDLIRQGVTLIEKNCANGCHKFGDSGANGLAPDLTGYGSYEWTLAFLTDPTHQRFYRHENDRMPSFAKDLERPEKNTVSVRELSLIVDWMRGDYFDAKDAEPVLPHTEEFARRTVFVARSSNAATAPVVGRAAAAPETAVQRVERLFKENCATCHSHVDAQGKGIVAAKVSAPNLFGIASRAWLAGLLDPKQVASSHFFGETRHFEGDMVNFVNDELKDLDEEKKKQLQSLIATLSAEAALPSQAKEDAMLKTEGLLEKGKEAITDTFGCVNCHKFHDAGDGSAPVLTGYGSREWLVKMISNPNHEEMYGKSNDRMPAFGKPALAGKKSLLSDAEIQLIARWLRGESLE